LKFIETQDNVYPTNSTGGNYTVTTGGTGKLHNTGYHEVNNIYDLGGNVVEWTTEICSNDNNKPYVLRGGVYNLSALTDSAASRGYATDTRADKNTSFRVTLFM